MEVDVVKAFQAPMTDQTWVNKVVIGGLVNIVPIVNFIAIGYGLTYFAGLWNGKDVELPEWRDWGGLFVIGLKAFVIMLVYMIGVIIFGALSMFMGGMLGGILAFIIFLAVMFLLPIALLRFVQEGYSIAPAFAFQEIYAMARAKMDEYMLVYAIIVGLSLVLAAITRIPLLGWILGSFAFFYLSLCFYNLMIMVFSTEDELEDMGTVDPGTKNG
ncbi:MAG: DUF4013 domain-containing protein [Syntrophaceae bacterium]